MIADNLLNGDTHPVYTDAIPAEVLLLDVRQSSEAGRDTLPEAINISIGELHNRQWELDSRCKIVFYRQVGLRGYLGRTHFQAKWI